MSCGDALGTSAIYLTGNDLGGGCSITLTGVLTLSLTEGMVSFVG